MGIKTNRVLLNVLLEERQNQIMLKRDKYHPLHSELNPNFNPLKNRTKLNATYPGGKKFVVLLTHDIDVIKPFFYQYFRFFKTLNFKSTIELFRSNHFDTFDKMIEIEKKYNVKSTYFFIAGGNDKPNRYNPLGLPNYYTSNKKFQRISKTILENGHEIGLHTGYNSFKNKRKMMKEKLNLEKAINSKVYGIRNHYLQFDVENTWRIQEECGFKYDSTYGYADQIGYRNGFFYPFRAYDIQNQKELNLVEFPLTIMDGTLNSYNKFSTEQSWLEIKKMIDNVSKEGGVLTILWHNNYFSDYLNLGWCDLYEKILKYCNSKKAWMPTMNKFLGGV